LARFIDNKIKNIDTGIRFREIPFSFGGMESKAKPVPMFYYRGNYLSSV
jgi:hypothetical protein